MVVFRSTCSAEMAIGLGVAWLLTALLTGFPELSTEAGPGRRLAPQIHFRSQPENLTPENGQCGGCVGCFDVIGHGLFPCARRGFACPVLGLFGKKFEFHFVSVLSVPGFAGAIVSFI